MQHQPPMQPPPMGAAPGPAKPADPAKGAAITLVVAGVCILVAMFSKNWVSMSQGYRDVSAHIGPMGMEACMGSICRDAPTGKMPGDVELIMMLALISGFASAGLAGWFGGATLGGKKDKLPAPKIAQIAFGLAAFSFVFFVIRIFVEGGSGLGPGWAMFPGIGGVIAAGVGLKKLIPYLPAKGAAQLPAGGQPAGWPAGAGAPGQQPSGWPAGAGAPGQQPGGWGGGAPGQPHGQQPYGQQPGGWPAGAGAPGQPGYGQPPHGQPQGQTPQQPYGQQPHAQQSQPMQPYGQPAAQQSQPMQPQQAAPNCPRCGQPLQFVAQYQRWFCAREQQYV